MQSLINNLKLDFQNINFVESSHFFWSPKNNQVNYVASELEAPVGEWMILHELGHALLEHKNYSLDIDLISMEMGAWTKAQELAKEYNISISDSHIQDCLDTYRNWLYERSACPSCKTTNTQDKSYQFTCYNCGHIWQVSSAKLCRPYRLSIFSPLIA